MGTCLPLSATMVTTGVATRLGGLTGAPAEGGLGVGSGVGLGEEDHGQDGSDEKQLQIFNNKKKSRGNILITIAE